MIGFLVRIIKLNKIIFLRSKIHQSFHFPCKLFLKCAIREPWTFLNVCIQKNAFYYREIIISKSYPNKMFILTFKIINDSNQSISNIHRKKKKKKRKKQDPFNSLLIIHAISRIRKNRNTNLVLCHCEIRFVLYRYRSAGIRSSVSCREIRRWFD